MTNNPNDLHQLVIRNLAILEAAPKVIEEIETVVFRAINIHIKNWYEEKRWEGKAFFYENDDTRIYPTGWPKDEDGNYNAYYTFKATNDDDYSHYLSALTGMALSESVHIYEFGLWFLVDVKAIIGQTNKVWREYFTEQVKLHPELERVGFKIFSGNKCSMYHPVRVDAELLAQAYPDVDEALAPIDTALRSLDEAHPVFDKILKNAMLRFTQK